MPENIQRIYDQIINCEYDILTGLVGSPVSHSLSPFIHNNAFRRLNLSGYGYDIFDVKRDELEDFVHMIKNNFILKEKINCIRDDINNSAKAAGYFKMILGFNVTMPHKRNISAYLDELKGSCALTGIVNTVKAENGRLTGYNTDGEGFFNALKNMKQSSTGKTMTILGAGGAAGAILVSAAEHKLGTINVINRSGPGIDNIRLILNKMINSPDLDLVSKINIFTDEDKSLMDDIIFSSDILVNATPIGMCDPDRPDKNEKRSFLGSFDALHPGLFVADLIYEPRMTELLIEADKRKLDYMNGLNMLYEQAALSFKIWTGSEFPQDCESNFY